MVRSAVVAVVASVALLVAPGLAPLALADSSDGKIDLADSTTAGGAGWTYASGVFTVTGDVTISGTTTVNRVVVQSGVTVNITLDNASIDRSGTVGACAFDMAEATVALRLAGTNVLKSGSDRAGLEVPDDATLTITNPAGDDVNKLTATGRGIGAGIGGGGAIGVGGGNITINGGLVTATGEKYGAGIGGGYAGAGGNITINGGLVTATSSEGAGIGGGQVGAGGNITISGGLVTAASGDSGAGIGGGQAGAGGNTVITGGTVKATGGPGVGTVSAGAGIGGGASPNAAYAVASGNITITGGQVIATGGGSASGGGGAGIGSGGAPLAAGAVGSIVVTTSGPTVTATGGSGGTAGDPRPGASIGTGGSSGTGGVAGVEVVPSLTVTYRTVAVTAVGNGTVRPYPNPSATGVPDGGNQTYLITPSAGYEVVSFTVDGVALPVVSSYTITRIVDDSRSIAAVFGVSYKVALSPSSRIFDTLPYGYSTSDLVGQSVTVSNIGARPTGDLTVTLGGTDSAAFSVSTSSLTSLAVDGAGSFTVTPVTGLGVGTYNATATVANTVSGISETFDVSFGVGLGPQVPLTLNGLNNTYTYGSGPFGLSVSGGSGDGGVTYVSGAPLVASVLGATVTLLQAGTFTITATKAADSPYDVAHVTSAEVTVSPATPTVGLSHDSAPAPGPLVLTATVPEVGTGTIPQGSVTFYDGTTVLATVTLDSAGQATHTINPLDADAHTYSAVYAGQPGKYNTASSLPVTYQAGKTNQTGFAITDPGTLTYGDGVFTLATTGGQTSSPGTFSVPADNGVVEVTTAGVVTIIGAGTITVTATKGGDSIYNPITTTLTITIDPRDITNVTIDVVGGQVYTGSQLQPVFAVTDGTIAINPGDYTNTYGPNLNAGTATGTVVLTGQRNYTGTKTVTFDIAKATQPAPPATLASEPTPTSVTLVTIPGAEYSLDGTTWQTSPTFAGLAPHTEYQFQVRLPGDANHNQSPTTTLKATTTKTTYPVLDHFGTWTTANTVIGRVDADHTKFTHLTISGTTLDPSSYTIRTDSTGTTLIELTQTYLTTLPEGDHTFQAHYTDGTSAPLTLTIQSNSTGQGTPTPTPGTNPTPSTTTTPGQLPTTGPNAPLPLLVAALLLLTAGTTLIRTRRITTQTR